MSRVSDPMAHGLVPLKNSDFSGGLYERPREPGGVLRNLAERRGSRLDVRRSAGQHALDEADRRLNHMHGQRHDRSGENDVVFVALDDVLADEGIGELHVGNGPF